jgi:hypothetical protein
MICRNFLLGTQNVGQIRETANQVMTFVDPTHTFLMAAATHLPPLSAHLQAEGEPRREGRTHLIHASIDEARDVIC